jgi:hypothetical protein
MEQQQSAHISQKETTSNFEELGLTFADISVSNLRFRVKDCSIMLDNVQQVHHPSSYTQSTKLKDHSLHITIKSHHLSVTMARNKKSVMMARRRSAAPKESIWTTNRLKNYLLVVTSGMVRLLLQ